MDVVRQTANDVSSGNRRHGGWGNGVRVTVDVEWPGVLELSICGDRRTQALGSFAATVAAGPRFTDLTIGPLSAHGAAPSKLRRLIPVGRRGATGEELYRWFLDAVARAIASADPEAAFLVAQLHAWVGGAGG